VRQTVQNFRNLEAWNKAHELTLQVYRITEGFPRTEIFGLTSQLRRAAASIAANLAEGCGRTQLEFVKFIQIAFGSASESEYHLLLARDLGFVNPEDYERLTT
jgi:four helix bundle protein